MTLEGDRGLLVERTFAAPRELVFKAWTDPEAIKRWWGPRPFPTTYCTLDARV
ncbi:MAG: SRPBCC domain-containing protein, partial [Anaerolineaceae bacterium]